MADTIEADGSAMRALRRQATRFVRRAARALASREPSDIAVHAARKDLKRARTVLRLLRPALGDGIYRRENAVLRDVAHMLNAARDAKMMAESLQSLRQSSAALRNRPEVTELLRAVRAEQARAHRRLEEHPAGVTRMQHALEHSCGRIDHWHMGRDGWSALGPALENMYRRGRRSVPNARQHPSDASLHEWRKQVKYLRYALEMLEPVRPRKLARLARQAERLTDSLGEGHDLAVLAHKAHDFARRKRVDLEPLFTMIDRRRNRLTVDALRSGAELFEDRPHDWERRLSRYWHR